MIKPRCKARNCTHCKTRFMQDRPEQAVCSSECGLAKAKASREKAQAKKTKEERRETKEKLEKFKKLGELRADAQTAFNRFIRLRDRLAGHGCICCGQPLNWNSTMPGGETDAGHFVSRGSAPELAFDERNVNAQMKGHNRPGGTTREKFRAGMVERYGEAIVAELEGPHEMPHLKHDDYRAIKVKYTAMAKELAKSVGNRSQE